MCELGASGVTWNECTAARSPFGWVFGFVLPVLYVLTGLPRSKIVPGTDKALPENSQPNLNKKLDRAVEETFPSRDPVSVSITKGGAADYDHDDDEAEDPSIVRSNLGQQGTSESLLTQAKEKLVTWGAPSRRPLMRPTPRGAVTFGKPWASTRRWSGTTGKARKQSDSRLPTTRC